MSKYNSLLKKVDVYEKLAVYGDRSAFLKSLAQPYLPQYDVPPAQPQTVKNTVITVPEKSKYPAISREIQTMLGKILSAEGFGLPIRVDGELGPETRNALNTFRNKFHVPDTFSDQEAYQFIRNTYLRNNKYQTEQSAPESKPGYLPSGENKLSNIVPPSSLKAEPAKPSPTLSDLSKGPVPSPTTIQ